MKAGRPVVWSNKVSAWKYGILTTTSADSVQSPGGQVFARLSVDFSWTLPEQITQFLLVMSLMKETISLNCYKAK